MSICEEQLEKECPLCMEQLDLDELNFFPCKCGYQICQFCWNRIKQEENGLCLAGLCPACRQPYPEQPVDFKPPSAEELKKIQQERRKREQQRKQKMSENRKHLANMRVVQKNLVLVHGLPPRLGDIESLKKNEYFGQFGKIHKIVIGTNNPTVNASAANPNAAQTPSSSVYVTYYKEEDAVKAILALNQKTIDGKVLRASLGTTKYCSCFLQNKPCQKADCMYLHEVGDSDASFTKEDMATKKHEEYERKVCEEIIMKLSANSTAAAIPSTTPNTQRDVFPSSAPSASCLLSDAVGLASSWKSRDISMAPCSGYSATVGDRSSTTPPPSTTSIATVIARGCRNNNANAPPPPRHRNRREVTQQSHMKEANKSMSSSPTDNLINTLQDESPQSTASDKLMPVISANINHFSVLANDMNCGSNVTDASASNKGSICMPSAISAAPPSESMTSSLASLFAQQQQSLTSSPLPATTKSSFSAMVASLPISVVMTSLNDWCNGTNSHSSVDVPATVASQSRPMSADGVGESTFYKLSSALGDRIPPCSTSTLLVFILNGATGNSSVSQQRSNAIGTNGLTKSSLLERLANSGKLSLESDRRCEEPLTLSNNHKVGSQADWQTTFGFNKADDDLGFDPFSESSKALEDLLREEKENEMMERQRSLQQRHHSRSLLQQHHLSGSRGSHQHNHQHSAFTSAAVSGAHLPQHSHHQQLSGFSSSHQKIGSIHPVSQHQSTTAAWPVYHHPQQQQPHSQQSQTLAAGAVSTFVAQATGSFGARAGHQQYSSQEAVPHGFASSNTMLRFLGNASSSDYKTMNGGPLYHGGIGSLNAQAAPFVPRQLTPSPSHQLRDVSVKDMQEQFKAFFPDANVKFASQLSSAATLPPPSPSPQVVCTRTSATAWNPTQRLLDPHQAIFSRPPPQLIVGGQAGGVAPCLASRPPPPGVKLSPPTVPVTAQPSSSSVQFGTNAFSADYSGWPVTGLAPTPPPGFAPPSHQLS